MKKHPYIILALIVMAGAAYIGFRALFAPVLTENISYYLRPGISKKTLVAELYQLKIIKHPSIFSFYIYTQKDSQLKTGEYLFSKGSTPRSIWRQVANGTGLLQRSFTIIPGWSFAQLREALAKTHLKPLTASWDEKQIMQSLGYANLSAEGQFFPETYYYTRDVQDLVILKRAIDLMQKRLQEAWNNRVTNLPYKNVYDALIAASLIEKEAYLNSERSMIAGVLVNRLRKNMLLQFDPTIIYGLGARYNGKIYRENLLEDTPYNTYIHKGLPPTPIAIPSMISIEAALHPLMHEYLYFVAKGDGSHQFSKTLPEHHSAVKAALIPTSKPQTNFNNERMLKHIKQRLQALKSLNLFELAEPA